MGCFGERLVRVMQPQAAGTDVNMRAGRFAGNGAAESVVGNALGLKIPAEPNTFRVAWVDSHINPSTMVET